MDTSQHQALQDYMALEKMEHKDQAALFVLIVRIDPSDPTLTVSYIYVVLQGLVLWALHFLFPALTYI